jgi:exopolysaccharide production protein ExoZ
MRTFAGIQAARGVAALSVVCGHAVTMRWGMGIAPETAFNALGFLQSGVDVFFVISGFIIANTAAETGTKSGRLGAFQFAASRAGRIFPLYWLVLVVAIASSYWIDIFPGSPPRGLIHIGIDHVFSLSTENYFVAPAWSLCFELYFYAAAGVVIFLTPMHVMAVLVLATCALWALDLMTVVRFSVYSDPLTLEFGFGIWIAFVVRAGFHPSWPRTTGILAACFFGVGAYIASGGHWITGFQRVGTYGIGSALLIYCVVAGELNGATFPRWLQYLGAMSYSLYISHHLLLTWLAKYNPRLAGPLQILIWLALALSLAALLYRFFERPLLAFTKAKLSQLSPAA